MNRGRTLAILGILALGALLVPCGLYADIYLSASGLDSNPGTTSGAPVQTVTHAITLWNGQPTGSDLHILDAQVYQGGALVVSVAGQTGNLARIFGDGAVPTLRGCVFDIQSASVEFANLVMEGTGQANGVLRIQNAGTDLHLTGVAVHGDPSCIRIDDGLGSGTRVDGLTIVNSVLHPSGLGGGVYIAGGVRATNILLDNVTIVQDFAGSLTSELHMPFTIADNTLANDNIIIRNSRMLVPTLTTNPNVATCSIRGNPCSRVRLENTEINAPLVVRGLNCSGYMRDWVITGCSINGFWNALQLAYGYAIDGLTIENCTLSAGGVLNNLRAGAITIQNHWNHPVAAWTGAGDGSRDLNNITIRNCNMSNATTGLYLCSTNGAGVRFKVRNFVLDNVTFDNVTEVPLYVYASDLQDCTFSNITASNFPHDCVDFIDCDGNGVYLQNVQADCSMQTSGYEAVWIDCSDPSPALLTNLFVEDCNFTNPNRNGIRVVSGAEGVTIRNNTIVGRCADDAAIKLTGEGGVPRTGAVISGNIIGNVKKGGIMVEAPWLNVTISGNSMAGAAPNGIELLDAAASDILGNIEIADNTVYDVTAIGIKIQGVNIGVHGNKIGNAPIGIHISPGNAPLTGGENFHGKDMKVYRNAILAGTGTDTGILMAAPTGFTPYGTGNAITNNTVDGYAGVGIDIVKDNNRVLVYNNVASGNGTGIALSGAGTAWGTIAFSFNGYDSNTTNNAGFTAIAHNDAKHNVVDNSSAYVSTSFASADFLKLAAGSLFIDSGSLDGTTPDPTPDAGDDIDLGWIESGSSGMQDWRLF